MLFAAETFATNLTAERILISVGALMIGQMLFKIHLKFIIRFFVLKLLSIDVKIYDKS